MNPSATSAAPHADRVLICANPRAGRKSALERVRTIEEALAASGYHVDVSTGWDELTKLVEKWHSEGRLRAVLSAGGDGTVAGLLNLIPAGVPVLPLPMGTANLLAGYLEQTAEPAAVVETLRHGIAVRLDAGRANGRLFLLMISAGFDAEVVRHMQDHRQGHITKASYLKPMLRAVYSYRYPEMRVLSDATAPGSAKLIACRWVFGFNLPSYACGLRFAPHADGTDCLLDLCTFRRGSLWHGLRYLGHVVHGSHSELSDVTTVRGRSFRIESANGQQVSYQLDGDMGGYLPVDVDVLPSRVSLLVRPKIAERLGFAVAS